MKIRSITLDAIVLVVMLFMLDIADVSAARNEHRPVCSADGSRLVYMLQTKQTNDDWELDQGGQAGAKGADTFLLINAHLLLRQFFFIIFVIAD